MSESGKRKERIEKRGVRIEEMDREGEMKRYIIIIINIYSVFFEKTRKIDRYVVYIYILFLSTFFQFFLSLFFNLEFTKGRGNR